MELCKKQKLLSKLSAASVKFRFNPNYPNFEFFHKDLTFGVFLSVDNYFPFKNSKRYVLMVPGPKY